MRNLLLALTFASLVVAADKPAAPVEGGNDTVDLTAFARVDRPAVTAALGGRDPGFNLIIVDVTVRPKLDNEVAVWHDDFTLISRRDGQRSQPLAPSQIAGKGSMTVTSRGVAASGVGRGPSQRGPIWGGTPGAGDRPRRLGGDQDVGSVAGAETKATVNNDSRADDPLLTALKTNLLAETRTKEPVSGRLYFILDGKHKLKDLELMYKTGSERVILDFVK